MATKSWIIRGRRARQYGAPKVPSMIAGCPDSGMAMGGDSCAKTHGSSKPLNGSQAAQRLSHSARRSVEDGPTAIRVCALARRRLPGSHAMPGIRGGETVWREEMRPAWMAGRPSPDLERCCKSAQYSFPCGVLAGTSPYPLILNGQTFRYLVAVAAGHRGAGRGDKLGLRPLVPALLVSRASSAG